MILDLFLIGLVVTLEPIPLTAMILLLAAERGLMKGLGFTLGWLLTLVGIVALTVLVTGGKPLIPQSAPSTGALALKLAIGVVLVVVAYRRNRRPSSDAPKKQPKWMSGIDRINPLAAAGLGFLLQPWVLVAEYFGVFAFCLWCTASYLALEIYAAVRPEAVRTKLNALLGWINTHTDQAIVFLSLGLGLYLMAKSIYGLVSGG